MPNISTLPLPFTATSLEPFMSEKTISFHYEKHYRGYIQKTNELIVKTPFSPLTLEEIIEQTEHDPMRKALFNQASQAWNHAFFWESLRANKEPVAIPIPLHSQIITDFGTLQNMLDQFKSLALSQFGSGWSWLVWKDGHIGLEKTDNAARPHGTPLWVLDVWEHAYYLDYQNQRSEYIEAVLNHLIHFEWIHQNFLNATQKK